MKTLVSKLNGRLRINKKIGTFKQTFANIFFSSHIITYEFLCFSQNRGKLIQDILKLRFPHHDSDRVKKKSHFSRPPVCPILHAFFMVPIKKRVGERSESPSIPNHILIVPLPTAPRGAVSASFLFLLLFVFRRGVTNNAYKFE